MLKFIRAIIVVALATICYSTVALSADNPRDSIERRVAKKTLPACVRIAVPLGDKIHVIGSGFVVDSRGYILTNDHVVTDEDSDTKLRILVGLYDERKQEGRKEWLEAEIVYRDAGNDLAVIKVDVDRPLPELLLGISSDLEVGEPVISIGNPNCESFTVTRGIVSRLRVPDERKDSKGKKFNIYMIQHDAAINPGNSGGPIFNANGEVIGINELKFMPAEGLGYAITADRATRVLAAGMSAANKAKVKHGVKAFETRLEEKPLKESYGRQALVVKMLEKDAPVKKAESGKNEEKAEEGKSEEAKPKTESSPAQVPGSSVPITAPEGRVRISDRRPVSEGASAAPPAEEKSGDAKPEAKPETKPGEAKSEGKAETSPVAVKLGETHCPLRKGDRVLKVEGRFVTNAFDFERAFWDKKPGDRVNVTVLRDGTETVVTIILGGEGVEPELKD